MIPIIQAYRYEKMEEFIKSISYGGELYNVFEKGKFVFRGHASDKYELIPSALRPQTKEWFSRLALSGPGKGNGEIEWFQIINEYNLLRRFYKSCDSRGLYIPNVSRIRKTFHDKVDVDTMLTNESWLPNDLWEIAALAQHYGIPTRLLDWSHDKNTALYFSVEDQLEGKKLPEGTKYIVLWALNINEILYVHNWSMPLCLVQPIYHGNPNLAAQQGMFTLWQIKKTIDIVDKKIQVDLKTPTNRKPLDVLIQEHVSENIKHTEPYLYKIELPLDEARVLYKYLKGIGYDASKIYPGYIGSSKAVLHEHFLYDDMLDKNPIISIATD